MTNSNAHRAVQSSIQINHSTTKEANLFAQMYKRQNFFFFFALFFLNKTHIKNQFRFQPQKDN